MIKRYFQFINESNKPGPRTEGSKKVQISEEEMNLFSQEPPLQKLITDDKISLMNCEVWYSEEDTETRDLLDQYLEMPGKI